MRDTPWKFLLRCAVGILPLVVFGRADSGSPNVTPAGSVPSFAGNPQHTAIYQPAVPNLNRIRWSATIDFNPSDSVLAHYGAPVVTAANTVLAPVKIAGDAFSVDAFDGVSGSAKYSLTTDYILPSHSWIPVYNPCLTTGAFGTRLYYAGAGGTVFHIDNPDSASHGAPVREVFYTTLGNYLANAGAYNASIFINTPLTPDSKGNIYFGFRVEGTAPAPLNTTESGFARIDANGNATYVLASAAAQNASITLDSHNSAPALSNDETTLYVVAKSSDAAVGYLLGLDSTTLGPKYSVLLSDPHSGSAAVVSDLSTASPTVAPDNDVYIGILENPGTGFRGWLLRFSADLTTQKLSGAFGWDYTPAIVPASMVPSYQGSSSYLLFCKYNNYAFGDGNGVNRVALLDPNSSQLDPHSTAVGFSEMREVLTLIGPTPDEDSYGPDFPYAVREWCINTAAVNPATNSIFVPNEDGHLYRWNVATNSFAQAVTLTSGIGEPYVPSLIGPDGTIFTLNGGTLFALGPPAGVNMSLTSSAPDVRTVVTKQPITFTATVTNPVSSGPVPTGTVTFTDLTYHDLTAATSLLADVPLDANGQASVTVPSLAAGNGSLGNHQITASYSGDANFPGATAAMVEKVHAFASTTDLTSSPNPSNPDSSVSFTATVTGGSPDPTGMVTFTEGTTVLAQLPLVNGTVTFSTSGLSLGTHTITATYQSDTLYALSSDSITQTVGIPSPTPTATATATPTATATVTPTATATANPTATATATATPTATSSPAQPLNLSTRMLVGNTEDVGIGGFIITGTKPKHILIRGIGPSLSQFNVPNTLADPFLELYSQSNRIAFNNDWRDTQEEAIKQTGAAPSNDRESAIDATLAPGTYTAVLKGNNGGSGIALVEVYDLDRTAGKLANISSRAFISNGDWVAIAGFILGENGGTDNLIIRGLGPSLADAGVSDPLPNPALELRNSNGDLVVANNNWQDDSAQAAKIAAAGLAPSKDLESGIAVTLPPGLYTAILFGEGSGRGIALVEVYDLGQ